MSDAPRLQYIDTRQGQIHVRSWAGPNSDVPVAVCLHPVPYSGRYFYNFATQYRQQSSVIAIDLPGYGSSARTDRPISIEDHAAAIGDALEALAKQIDAPAGFMPVGFHTGSGVGGELALSRPDLITRLALVTYPFVPAAKRAELLKQWDTPPAIPESLEELQSQWAFAVGNRAPAVTLDDAFDYFAEQIRTGNRSWHGFHAMYSYAAEQRLPKIQQRVLLVNPPDVLHESTAAAAALLSDPKIVEPDYGKKAIFDANPKELAQLIFEFARA